MKLTWDLARFCDRLICSQNSYMPFCAKPLDTVRHRAIAAELRALLNAERRSHAAELSRTTDLSEIPKRRADRLEG